MSLPSIVSRNHNESADEDYLNSIIDFHTSIIAWIFKNKVKLKGNVFRKVNTLT